MATREPMTVTAEGEKGRSVLVTPTPPAKIEHDDPSRTSGETSTDKPPSFKIPEYTHPFKSSLEPHSTSLPGSSLEEPSLEWKIKLNPDKVGLVFLCCCTGEKESKNYIANCRAPEVMGSCFHQLGYLVHSLGTNVTSHQLSDIYIELSRLDLPSSYSRVVFYYFGHGNENAVSFADEYVDRERIINQFQSMWTDRKDLFKIFFFDSCREVAYKYPIPETGSNEATHRVLSGENADNWETSARYPKSVNTLVIYATSPDSKAYYLTENGCGLMTAFFAELAPTCNVSIYDLLVFMRKKITDFTEKNKYKWQVLVYEDQMMASIYLLAESKGKARVIPTEVTANRSTLSTSIHWKFADNVQSRIKHFSVEYSSDVGTSTKTEHPKDRMTTLSELKSGQEYEIRVAAVYDDGVKARSDKISFTSPGRVVPQAIKVDAAHPGSPRGTARWQYHGQNTDLLSFQVTILTDGKKVTKEVAATLTETEIEGLCPLVKSKITVAAVYRDGITTESSMEFSSEDRSFCSEISIEQDIHRATVKWPVLEHTDDLDKILVKVEDKDENVVYECPAGPTDGKAAIKNLQSSAQYKVTVTAHFKNEITRKCSKEFYNCKLNAATDLTRRLIHISESEATVELQWKYQPMQDPPLPVEVEYFKVHAIPQGDDDDQTTRVEEPISNSSVREFRLKLELGKSYSLKVSTHYASGDKEDSTEIEYDTPPIDKVRLRIESTENIDETSAIERIKNMYQTSTLVVVSPPKFLNEAKYCSEGLHIPLANLRYTVKHLPNGKEKKGHLHAEDIPGIQAGSLQGQLWQGKVPGLRPGRKYRLKVSVEYGSGDCRNSVNSLEEDFNTQKPRVCSLFAHYCGILPLLILSLLCLPYIVTYTTYLHNSAASNTYYIMSLDEIFCGEANSLHFSGIKIEGFLDTRDSLQGTIRSWLIRKDNLKLYYYQNPPATTTGNVTELNNGPALLNGWQIYSWKTSEISGFCCVSNHNDTNISASLYMFRNDKDAYNFMHGKTVTNAILSDTLTLRPNTSDCFRKWETESPYYVEENAYHYLVLDTPVNTSFSANVSILQAYVNTSDYPNNPNYFRYDNSTYFSISNHFFHPTTFLTICEAPLYNIINVNNTKLEAVSLHIRTRNTPYNWMEPIFITCIILGAVLVLLFCALLFYCLVRDVHICYGYFRFGSDRSYNRLRGSSINS